MAKIFTEQIIITFYCLSFHLQPSRKALCLCMCPLLFFLLPLCTHFDTFVVLSISDETISVLSTHIGNKYISQQLRTKSTKFREYVTAVENRWFWCRFVLSLRCSRCSAVIRAEIFPTLCLIAGRHKEARATRSAQVVFSFAISGVGKGASAQ